MTLTTTDQEAIANMISAALKGLLESQKAAPVAPRTDLRPRVARPVRSSFRQSTKTREEFKALATSTEIVVREIAEEERVATLDRGYTEEEAGRLGWIGAANLKHMDRSIRVQPNHDGVAIYYSIEHDGIVEESAPGDEYIMGIPAFMKLIEHAQFHQNFSYKGGKGGFSETTENGETKRRGIGSTFVVSDFTLYHVNTETGDQEDSQHFQAMRFFVPAMVANAFAFPILKPGSNAAKIYQSILSRNPDLFQVSEHYMADYAFFTAHLNVYNRGGGNTNILSAMRRIARVTPRQQSRAGVWYGHTNAQCLVLYKDLNQFRALRAENWARNLEYQANREQQQNSAPSSSANEMDESELPPF